MAVASVDQVEVCERSQADERAAFDRLIEQLRPAALGYLRRFAGELEDAEALVQEAFLALWLARERLRGPDFVLPFVYRVLRNLTYTELRRRGAWDRNADVGELESLADSLTNGELEPDQQLVQMLALAELRQAIDSLPEPQREALILYAQAELSYPQIAAATGCDLGTVKSRMHYARRNLRARLRPEVLDALGLAAPGDVDDRGDELPGARIRTDEEDPDE